MKRIIPILSIILLITINTHAQVAKNTPASDGGEKTLKLYPIPASSYITFDLQKGFEKGLAIQVYNFLGRKMYETQASSEKTTIDLGAYNRGVYIYHLRDQSGKIIESGKFQVSK